MQTISWADEIKLFDGIPYDIDFFKDFSTIFLEGHSIMDIPIASIIKFISNPKAETGIYAATQVTYSAEEYRCSQEFQEWFDEYEEERKECEIKWEKGRKKRKKRAKWLFDDIESGRYFVKW